MIDDYFTEESALGRLQELKDTKAKLYVWYGYRKMTKKAIRKRELIVVFENGDSRSDRKMAVLKRHFIFYRREQTEDEIRQGMYSNRQFTVYSYFLDSKPFFGDIEKALDENFLGDVYSVSEKERKIIRQKLREGFFSVFDSAGGQNKNIRSLLI